MLNQEVQTKDISDNNSQPNPLNDHDYCSPNKRSTRPQEPNKLTSKVPERALPSSTPLTYPSASASSASTSSSPDPLKASHGRPGIHPIAGKKTISDGNLSDSSSSLSSSSSVASSKDLVIAQDQLEKPIRVPKSTPSVSKGKFNRSHKVSRLETKDGSQETTTVRAKRPARQSTSVTDKSEWIMGDDQIDSILSDHLDDEPKEKRHKPSKEHDSAFNQYTSSDYSSSAAESDLESDYNSEDDPNKLWCTCQKPHNNKFMIECDICKDWFHGHCVGVTKLMGDRFAKQGKEWFCPDCQEKLRSGEPRNAIPKKIVKREKTKKKSIIPGKRGRGRPRKSETNAGEGATRVSQRSLRKSSSSLDPKLGVDNGRLRKNLTRASEARSESYDDFSDGNRLKELIKERKASFFYKRRLAEQQKAEKRRELGLGRQSLTASLSDSLDSLATSTSTPNMSNLPINIKSEHRKSSKPNIVLQINTKRDSTNDQNNSRIVTAIVRSPKKNKDSSNPTDLFTAEPIQISKKVKIQMNNFSAMPISSASGDAVASSTGDTVVRKRSTSGSPSSKNDKAQGEISTATPKKKKRKDSESGNSNGSSTPIGSKHIAQKIKDTLESRSKQIEGLKVPSDKIEKLATEIEGQLNECFKEGTQKYLNKFRSLYFNLRDQKNQGLVRNVLTGEITPARLVRMSPDEMASHELAKWRERENKHSIELIKRDAQLAAQQVIVKKTHKGEEVISAPSLNEPDDPTVEVDNQEIPTTPTKHASKDLRATESSRVSLSPHSATLKSSGSIKMKITGINVELTGDRETANASTPSIDDPLPFLDTTKDHKNHVFDMNCKICTKQDISPSPEPSSKQETSRIEAEQSQQVDQPKRLRVSIDTKLDPANLSRLKEPLIKPVLQAPMSSESGGFSPSTNNALDQEAAHEAGDDDDEEYDPESVPILAARSIEPIRPSIKESWSGSITMQDIATFSASARPVSGSTDFMREEIQQSLVVCGRIAPDQVQDYIKKLKTTPKNQILVIQLFPLADEDKKNFDTFFDYLYSRNRYGVIQVSPQSLKDFYIIPIQNRSNVPEILRPIRGPGIDRTESNCLLGLLVRSKRPPPLPLPTTTTSTSATIAYTPTPIK